MAPNPEFDQNVLISLPMIVAEELDVDWDQVVVEQAPFRTDLYTRQFDGGSQSIRQGYNALRTARATSRQMLINASAKVWNVSASEITTTKGFLKHTSDKKSTYGEMAEAGYIFPFLKNTNSYRNEDILERQEMQLSYLINT